MRKPIYFLVLLAALASLAGCGPSSQTQAPDQSAGSGSAVDIKGFVFGPKTLTVKKGASVTFTNDDSAPHTATADDMSFDTGTLSQGDSKSVSFDTAGTIPYICEIHPFMHGEIVVQ